MATALVTAVAGIAVGAAVLAGPGSSAEPCAQWESDAQVLADELAGVPGADAESLRRELEAAGFVAGGAAPEGGGWSHLLVELLVAVLGALDTDGDGEVPVTVLGQEGVPTPACPDG